MEGRSACDWWSCFGCFALERIQQESGSGYVSDLRGGDTIQPNARLFVPMPELQELVLRALESKDSFDDNKGKWQFPTRTDNPNHGRHAHRRIDKFW